MISEVFCTFMNKEHVFFSLCVKTVDNYWTVNLKSNGLFLFYWFTVNYHTLCPVTSDSISLLSTTSTTYFGGQRLFLFLKAALIKLWPMEGRKTKKKKIT